MVMVSPQPQDDLDACVECAPSPHPTNTKCIQCGAVVRRTRKIDYLARHCESGEETNAYVLDFDRRFRKMVQEPRYHAVADLRHLRKEVSESMAVVHELEHHIPSESRPLIVDCCCGVGASTALLAAAFAPTASVIGIDNNAGLLKQAHYFDMVDHSESMSASGDHARREMLVCDMNYALPEVRRRVSQWTPDHVSVVAVHACGLLALSSIDVFVDAIHADGPATSAALVLVPCCMPSSKVSDATQGATSVSDAYERWCDALASEVKAVGGRGVQCSWRRDPLITSERNVLICATWEREGSSCQSEASAKGGPDQPTTRTTLFAREREHLERRRLEREKVLPKVKHGANATVKKVGV